MLVIILCLIQIKPFYYNSLGIYIFFIYTTNNNKDPEKQKERAMKRVALAEYYEKHGGGDHH